MGLIVPTGPGAQATGLVTPHHNQQVLDILKAARELELPSRCPVRIRSTGTIRRSQSRIAYVAEGVSLTAPGGGYWSVSGAWYTNNTPVWEDWQGYQFEFIGRIVPPTVTSTHPLIVPVQYPGIPEGIRVEIWRQRAYCDGSPAFAQILRRPDDPTTGRASIVAPSPVKTRDKRAAKRGLHLLHLLPMVGRPWEDTTDARRRLLSGLLELKQRGRMIDREALSGWTHGVTSIDGVADLLDRAGWAMTARTGKPVAKDIADELHTLRRRLGLEIAAMVDLAEQAHWDLDQLRELANKTHVGHQGGI